MKKVVSCILLIMFLLPVNVYARSGCCSHHGGVSGACRNGHQVCNDGTTSPSCTCSGGTSDSSYSSTASRQIYTPSYTYGCTDKNAINYNPSANRDDGSCISKVLGCTDKNAKNYNASANTNDNSCQYEKTITEKETIKYDTKYIDNDELEKDKTKVKIKGVNGEKAVTYLVLVDKDGKEISREKQSEKIITKATNEVVEKGTKIEDGNPFVGIWIICTVISFYTAFKNKEGNLILNKIQKQNKIVSLILYFLYIFTFVPPFIDIIKIIINKIKKQKVD